MKNISSFSKDFIMVVVGQIISLFGNQILRCALPLYLLNKTSSSALFGIISAFSFIPMVLLFPIGGIIADRVNKRNVMVILDFATSLLVMIFYFLFKKTDIIVLMAVTMMILYAIQGVYQPAVNSSIPILVKQEYIIQANSIVDIVSSMANMLGPVLGGILFSFFGLTKILYISSICFLLSDILEIFINIPFEKQVNNETGLRLVFNDLKSSFRFITKEQTSIWKLAVIYSLCCLLLTSLMNIAVTVIITQYLDFSVDIANRMYGYAGGVIAFGSILGGILSGLLANKITPKFIKYFVLGCATPMFVCGVFIQFIHSSFIVYILLSVCCGILMTISSLFQIQVMTYVQLLTPNHQIGKVISCVICICMCANPIGSFLYGFIFEHIWINVFLPFYIASLILFIAVFKFRKNFIELEYNIESYLEKYE